VASKIMSTHSNSASCKSTFRRKHKQ
jgi:hypothetical protein